MANPSSFKVGDEVEITSAKLWHRGALFPGIIVGPSLEEKKLMVEYKTRMDPNDESGLKPLREAVNLGLIRPLPPRETDYCFKFSDLVDAFFDGGWWEGTITEVLEENSRYMVYFRFCKKQRKFQKSCLRIHRELIRGTWHPPFTEEEEVTSKVNTSIVRTEEKFSEGTPVEVGTNEDGFQGAWFAATIVKEVGKDKFLVQYEKLRTDDDKESLKEEIDMWHIRPIPPEAVVVDSYTLNEAVDALYNDGWWEGVISKVLQKSRYKVYFKGTDDEAVFEHSDLRPHYDWIDGTWVTNSQVLKF